MFDPEKDRYLASEVDLPDRWFSSGLGEEFSYVNPESRIGRMLITLYEESAASGLEAADQRLMNAKIAFLKRMVKVFYRGTKAAGAEQDADITLTLAINLGKSEASNLSNLDLSAAERAEVEEIVTYAEIYLFADDWRSDAFKSFAQPEQ
jgi:hypothetical protein